jgi:hypothetical protein
MSHTDRSLSDTIHLSDCSHTSHRDWVQLCPPWHQLSLVLPVRCLDASFRWHGQGEDVLDTSFRWYCQGGHDRGEDILDTSFRWYCQGGQERTTMHTGSGARARVYPRIKSSPLSRIAVGTKEPVSDLGVQVEGRTPGELFWTSSFERCFLTCIILNALSSVCASRYFVRKSPLCSADGVYISVAAPNPGGGGSAYVSCTTPIEILCDRGKHRSDGL